MNQPILFATPLSHFARKVRILLAELDVPFELRFVPNLLSSDPADFGGNPILRIPTLLHGERWIIESDQIVRYIVETWDPGDRLGCLALDPEQRNVLSILSALMAAEVELILSARSGIEGVDAMPYFQRHHAVIEHCLVWLEEHGRHQWLGTDDADESGAKQRRKRAFSYLDVTLVAAWEHLQHKQLGPNLERFPWLAERVALFAERPSVAPSAPRLTGL
jgi:glutathione S-transferase